jgi:hypothetical protein
MNTLQLQLNKKITALSLEHPYEYATLRILFIVAGLLIFAYLYLVSASVLNVIAQKEADRASSALESDLGELEGTYFALSQDITPEQAAKLGLRPLSGSSFVYRLSNVSAAPATHNAI